MRIEKGRAAPLGATLCGDGVNFSVYAWQADRVELLLFDGVDARDPSEIIQLTPEQHRSFYYWHAFIHGVRAGQVYAYRVHGPRSKDLHFDGEKVLIDPYGQRVITPPTYDRMLASRPGSTLESAMRSAVVDLSTYDWEGDESPQIAFPDTVIYELHVAGFTKSPTSGIEPDRRGTYAGLIEKIPYLKSLGITAVELLPVFAFDPYDAPPGRHNYWGYSPVSFFAPHAAYSSRQDLMGPLDEFRDMVKALHRAGLEVILDVVFNHTAEGAADGPTFGLRGFESSTYYILEDGAYANYSGTGNTVNANQSVTRRMILQSLRFWVEQMHVDGFRFDLASILARDESGTPQDAPQTLLAIETDPILATTKLIAEPWDAAGLYQVGTFIGDRWSEWNGRFRDDVRAFVRGDPGQVPALANRLMASPDIYEKDDRDPEQTVNFITCHDGFTLNDLVSYDRKHNEANGEDNRDGHDHNVSWNHGVEGPTDDPEVEALRLRQIKNFMTLNLISVGVPMVLMGDEIRRTQLGNNNAYSQDNEVSWFDWRLVERHADLLRFFRELTTWRREWRPPRNHGTTLGELLQQARIRWHGVRLGEPDWSESSRSLALTVGNERIHAIFNAYWEPLDFELPPASHPWRRFVDTALSAPEDVVHFSDAPAVVEQRTYHAAPRSTVLLLT